MLQKLITKRWTVLHAIFLDLHNSYDALDRELCLDILEGYGVEPIMIHILQPYWAWLQMAEYTGGHYGTAFQIHYVVNKVDPCHPRYLTCFFTLSSDTG